MTGTHTVIVGLSFLLITLRWRMVFCDVDDEPEDGAQLYILLIGFNNPHLPNYLSAAGVHLNCIIRISSEDYSRFPPSPLEAMHLDKCADLYFLPFSLYFLPFSLSVWRLTNSLYKPRKSHFSTDVVFFFIHASSAGRTLQAKFSTNTFHTCHACRQ